jgi:hypothetical protein
VLCSLYLSIFCTCNLHQNVLLWLVLERPLVDMPWEQNSGGTWEFVLFHFFCLEIGTVYELLLCRSPRFKLRRGQSRYLRLENEGLTWWKDTRKWSISLYNARFIFCTTRMLEEARVMFLWDFLACLLKQEFVPWDVVSLTFEVRGLVCLLSSKVLNTTVDTVVQNQVETIEIVKPTVATRMGKQCPTRNRDKAGQIATDHFALFRST